MQRIFSLYGRPRRSPLLRPQRPSSRRRPSRAARLLFVPALLLALLFLFNFGLYPGVCALALAAAKNEAAVIVAAAFSENVAEAGERYEDLVTLHFREDGGISGMSCHMPALNAARNAILRSVLTSIGQERVLSLSIPLGNILGGELLSGRGPDIPVRILLARSAAAHIESEFLSAGINQTLHRILFTVEITLTVLTPSHPTEVILKQSFPMAETVIVGTVPDAFTQINRLTDTITEQDIDDIFDFGAEAEK